MSVSYNSTPIDSVDFASEDLFAYLVQPQQLNQRTNESRSRGILREDSFLRIASTKVEAENMRVFLREKYGIETELVPISLKFAPGAQVSLSLSRLTDVEAGEREPDIGDLIQYTGDRITINGVDSPKYSFSRIDTQYVVEHSSNLYYTNSRVSEHIAASSLDTITPSEGDNSTKVATTQYTDRAIASLIDSAPSTLDTLNELAAALNDDADFHTTMLNANAAIQSELDATQLGAGLAFSGAYAEDSSSNYLQSASSLRNADSLLDSAIFAIQNELDATQAGAGLDTDGSYIAKTDANYIDGAVSLQDADEKLDAQSKVNAAAISAETTARQNADTSLQTELDTTQSGAGLSVSGQYVANSSSTHLTTATSLKDADNKLDAVLGNLHAVATSGSYDDLEDKPGLFSGSYNDLTDVPSGVDLSEYATETYVDNAVFSGDYNDLENKPTIPSLTGYATETYVTTAINNLVDGAPDALDTLNELADAINDDANVYDTLIARTASSSTLGQIKIGYSANAKNYPVELDTNNRAYVNVPWVSSTGGGGISLDDISVTSGSASGGGSLSYNNTTGVFSFTPASIPTIPTVPTNTSDLTNDSGFITSSSIPSVPTNNNQLTNGAGYLSSIPAATSQHLGGVKVSFSNGNLYISTS